MFRLKTSSRIKNSKLKSRRSEIIVHLHIAIVRILNKALIVMLQGRCAETFLDKNCFRVPLLWLLWNLTQDMSTWLPTISFSFSTESKLHKDFIITKISDHDTQRGHLFLLFNRKQLFVSFTCGQLWTCKSLRDVKALQTRKNLLVNGFKNLLLQELASLSQNFKGELCCWCWWWCYKSARRTEQLWFLWICIFQHFLW